MRTRKLKPFIFQEISSSSIKWDGRIITINTTIHITIIRMVTIMHTILTDTTLIIHQADNNFRIKYASNYSFFLHVTVSNSTKGWS